MSACFALSMAVAVLVAACSSLPLLPRFLATRDLACAESELRVVRVADVAGRAVFEVQGCGRSIRYLCDEFAGACVVYTAPAAPARR